MWGSITSCTASAMAKTISKLCPTKAEKLQVQRKSCWSDYLLVVSHSGRRTGTSQPLKIIGLCSCTNLMEIGTLPKVFRTGECRSCSNWGRCFKCFFSSKNCYTTNLSISDFYATKHYVTGYFFSSFSIAIFCLHICSDE